VEREKFPIVIDFAKRLECARLLALLGKMGTCYTPRLWKRPGEAKRQQAGALHTLREFLSRSAALANRINRRLSFPV
jgi:hypothetical protein